MKNKQKPSKLKSLYSKTKSWVMFHRNTSIAIVMSALVLLACIVLLIGGAVAGWDIAGALTSPTAVLIYVVAGLVTLWLIYTRVTERK